jgi:limonene-1,2-epoxide hydrolase
VSTGALPAEPVARVVAFYETLTPDSLGRLGEVYAVNARFKDPFNEVTGLAPIEAIFRAMFDELIEPRFRVLQAVGDASRACLIWEFDFGNARIEGGRPQRIRGATWLEFDSDARVSLHRDYWDAAEELYEKLPVVGALARWLKRRIAH